MILRSLQLACVTLLALALPCSFGQELHARATQRAEKVTRIEAEIEIYLLPVCREVRAKGSKAGWRLMERKDLNQSDYYFFWVFVVGDDAKVQGSVLLGHFAVNKWTGDVWDLWDFVNGKHVLDSELLGLQRILIAGHGIDEATIQEYGQRPLWAPETTRPRAVPPG